MHKTIAGSVDLMEILESDSDRVGAILYNDTNKALFVLLGFSASRAKFTTILLPGSYWEIPESYKFDVTAVSANNVLGDIHITTW